MSRWGKCAANLASGMVTLQECFRASVPQSVEDRLVNAPCLVNTQGHPSGPGPQREHLMLPAFWPCSFWPLPLTSLVAQRQRITSTSQGPT